MTDWAIKKIIVVAEDRDNPMCTTTLELDQRHLHSYLGMFWASEKSAETLDHFYRVGFPDRGTNTLENVLAGSRASSGARMLKSGGSANTAPIPAVYLKDPECTLFEFP